MLKDDRMWDFPPIDSAPKHKWDTDSARLWHAYWKNYWRRYREEYGERPRSPDADRYRD